jgi:hypothetical protein
LKIDVADLKQHPLAEEFKLVPEKQLRELAEDIKRNGAHEKIVIHELMILDGGNRYAAFKLNGHQFTGAEFCIYDALCSGDPRLYVISRNLMRRHLPEDLRAALAEEHWQRIKKKPGPKTEQKEILGKPEKTPAQQKQESRERKEQVAAAYGTTVNAMEEHTRLRKADPEKAEEVKAGKTTQRQAIQEVAKKTGKRAPRQPKLVMELKDGLTLAQIFHKMVGEGYKILEGSVTGRGRVVFTLDADVKPQKEITESGIIEIAAAQDPPISKSDALDMLDSCRATGRTYKDWAAALRNWSRRGWLWSQKPKPPPQRASPSQRAPVGSTVLTPAQADLAAAELERKIRESQQ